MKSKITKTAVEALQPGESIADSEVRGFVARRLPSGAITYGFRYSARGGRKWMPLGLHGNVTADEARRSAKRAAGSVADGRDPVAEQRIEESRATNTVTAVLANFAWRYLRKNKLRSAKAIVRTFRRLVRPRIGAMSIYDVKRRDIVDMLDAIEDDSGPVMADRCLAYLRKAFNWQEARDEDFRSPIVKGMARTKPGERKRERILDDQEIRDVWTGLDQLELGVEAPDCYPRFVRGLLLSAQRRTNVSHAHRDEVSGSRWVIPALKMKGKKAQLVPLTLALQRLLGNRTGFLFSSDDDGAKPFSGYSKAKKALDRRIADLRKADGRERMPHWTLHDLRRTARSILSRYATPDIGERVIGHVIPGVRGTNDLYEYADEKCAALEALAAHIERILDPTANVIAFPPKAV
jgi:integrase